jgi:hypothetical protein
MLGEQTKGCALSKGDYLASIKIECISHPLFLEYLIFFVFFKVLTSLKKNKRMLRYKVGTCVAGKQTSSKCMEHIDA